MTRFDGGSEIDLLALKAVKVVGSREMQTHGYMMTEGVAGYIKLMARDGTEKTLRSSEHRLHAVLSA